MPHLAVSIVIAGAIATGGWSCAGTTAAPGSASGAAAATPAAAAPAAANELAVPFADPPLIDGKLDDQAWSQARVVELARGVILRFVHDGAKVYIGVSGIPGADSFGFTCVLIAEPGAIGLLHASAKLGSARYLPAGDGAFAPQSKTYDWQPPDALLRDEGWTATTAGELVPRQQEFALTFARLGLPAQPRPIAIGYFAMTPGGTALSDAETVVWPTGLDDATANVALIAGFNPDGLRFAPDRWVVVRPQPR
jgi:hypothetical protein